MRDFEYKFNNTLSKVVELIDTSSIKLNIIKTYVYGSYAEGTFGSKSDLDIFIVFKTEFLLNEDNRDTIRDFMYNMLYNPKTMEVEVDVHVATESDWDNDTSILIDQVKRKGKEIWPRNRAI